jgi:hypothetical protein
MAEQVMTEKTAKELTDAIKSLTIPTKELVRKGQGNPTTQQPLQTVGASDTTKFMKKEDPAKNYYKNSLLTLKEILKVNKDILKNSMQKFTMGLGSLAMIGGLLGWLLTGKTDLLNLAVKAFEKKFILPLGQAFDKILQKIAKFALKFLEKPGAEKAGGKIAEKVGTSIGRRLAKGKDKLKAGEKIAEKAGTSIGRRLAKGKDKLKAGEKYVWRKGGAFAEAGSEGAVRGIEKMSAKELEKAALKTTEKAGLKGLIKGGSKLGLKALTKIPILGTILGPVVGLIFAFEKWKKGDYVGALMELGSGFLAMIPFLGTPLSIAMDLIIGFRDLKRSQADIDKSALNKPKNVTLKMSDAILDGLPVIGTIRAYNRMKKKWAAKDPVGAFMELGMGFGSFIPGLNTTIEIMSAIFKSGTDISGQSNVGALGKPVSYSTDSRSPSADADIDALMNGTNQLTNFKPTNYNVPMSPEAYMATTQKAFQTYSEYSKDNPLYIYPGATINGLRSNVKQNLLGMGQEYYALTGQKLQINSAYRDYAAQKKLYNQYKAEGKPEYASNPDDPVTGKPRAPRAHMRGVAVDIQSSSADYLDQTGLLSKYGFKRPLMQLAGQPQNIKEPWHIQAPEQGDFTNSDAISPQSFAMNMDKINKATGGNGMKDLINILTENNKKLMKTILSQKMSHAQSLSINSAG